jgi:hypothetical protein
MIVHSDGHVAGTAAIPKLRYVAWIPMLSTVLGAVIGLGSALVGDRVRWRREQSDRWLSARREVYVGYLNALHEANQGMRPFGEPA